MMRNITVGDQTNEEFPIRVQYELTEINIPYTIDYLILPDGAVRITASMSPDKNVYLHIDLKQRGVGGDNSWGALPNEEYRLLDKKYSYSYVIRAIE